jgi:hypothetical protein
MCAMATSSAKRVENSRADRGQNVYVEFYKYTIEVDKSPIRYFYFENVHRAIIPSALNPVT